MQTTKLMMIASIWVMLSYSNREWCHSYLGKWSILVTSEHLPFAEHVPLLPLQHIWHMHSQISVIYKSESVLLHSSDHTPWQPNCAGVEMALWLWMYIVRCLVPLFTSPFVFSGGCIVSPLNDCAISLKHHCYAIHQLLCFTCTQYGNIFGSDRRPTNWPWCSIFYRMIDLPWAGDNWLSDLRPLWLLHAGLLQTRHTD